MTLITPSQLKTIPGPRGLPFLGVMPEMISDMLGLFTNTAREYGGIAQFKLLNKSYLLVTNPDYVKYILQDNYKNYIRGRSVETGKCPHECDQHILARLGRNSKTQSNSRSG